MIKFIKYGTILSFIGMLIILLHSMVPHEHNDKYTATQSIEIASSNLADIILIDIGISHLENLKFEEILILFFGFAFLLYFLINIFNKKVEFQNKEFSFQKKLLSTELSHRGPPISLV